MCTSFYTTAQEHFSQCSFLPRQMKDSTARNMCTQTRIAHIPHNMLREVKVQIARWHQGGTPIPHTTRVRNLARVNKLEDLGGDRQTKNDKFTSLQV